MVRKKGGGQRVKRKTFAAREDLLNQLSKIAERRDLSLFLMVNELFELAIETEEIGANLKKMVDEYGLLQRAEGSGFILVPECLWHELVEENYRKGKRQALKKWFEAGEWIAKRYISSDFEDPFEAFKVNLESFTWNVSEFNMSRDEEAGTVSVRLISPRFSESHATLFSSLLKGALQAFGYNVASKDVSASAIRIKAERGKTRV